MWLHHQPWQNSKQKLRETQTTDMLALRKLENEETLSMESYKTDMIPINSLLLLLHVCLTFDFQSCMLQQVFLLFLSGSSRKIVWSMRLSHHFVFHQSHNMGHTWMMQLSSISCQNDAKRHVDTHIQIAQNQQWLFSSISWFCLGQCEKWGWVTQWGSHAVASENCHLPSSQNWQSSNEVQTFPTSLVDAVLTHPLILVLNHEADGSSVLPFHFVFQKHSLS